MDAVRFLFDGARIMPNQTPKDVRARAKRRPSRVARSRETRGRAENAEFEPRHRPGGANIFARLVSPGVCSAPAPPAPAPTPIPTSPIPPPSLPQLDMEDGDSIDAMMEQVGGC